MSSQDSGALGSGIDAIVNFYRNAPLGFGAGDIFCCGPFDTIERVGDLVFVLSMVQDENGQCPITEFNVVLPSASEHTAENVLAGFCDAVARHRGRPLSEKEREILPRRLKVLQLPDSRVQSAASIVETVKPHSVIIFCDGANFRDEELNAAPVPTPQGIRLEEDVWAAHFHGLAERAIAAAIQNKCYVVLDAGRWRPHRAENVDLLKSIEHCGVMGAEYDRDPDAVIAAHGNEWLANIRAGQIGAVIAAIDSLPAAMNRHKSSFKIQMFHRAGLLPQAVELIRSELANNQKMSAEGSVKLALIATEAKDHDLAGELLVTALAGLTSQEFLELALSIASDIEELGLEEQASARLASLFPDSHYLQRHRLRTLLRKRDYPAIRAMLAAPLPGIEPDAAEFHAQLASVFSQTDKPDYVAVLGKVANRWQNRLVQARLACIRDAEARGLFLEALGLAMSLELSGGFAKQSAWALLHAIEQLLIRRNEDGELGIDPADLNKPILALVCYLAQNPSDGETRVALARLLSVQVTGSYGLPVIAAATLKLAQEMPAPAARPAPARQRIIDESEFDEIGPFLRVAMEWLAAQGMVILGRTALPKTLVAGQPVDRHIYVLSRMIEHVGQALKDESDITYLEKLLAVATATAPHTNTPNFDLVLIRLVAGIYINVGRVQHARDLAENALQIAGDDSLRSRIAWYGFADIYHRLNNLTESLIAMACALSREVEIGPEEAWYETHGLIRLLRDLNMAALAGTLLPTARDLLNQLGAQETQGHRLETIELGLRFREFTASTPSEEELTNLIVALAQNCKTVSERHDELTPATILLAQVMCMAEAQGVDIPEAGPESLEAALAQLGEPNASLIRTVSTGQPAAADVLSLARRLEPARYAEDAGFDVRFATITARRLLDTVEASGDAKVAAFAIELLADHAIRLRASGTAQPASALPSSVEEPGEIAREVSREGITVHLLGLSESNRLARVTAQKGVLGGTLYELDDVFSKSAFDQWSGQYPYRYGFDSDDPNMFYNSMAKLGLTAVPDERGLVVADVALQQLPPNLLMISGDFIGRSVPVAAAPSLSWLKDVRTRPDRTGAPYAWIPISTAPEADQTLAILKDRLTPTLEEHRIAVDTDLAIPDGLRGSQLAIIAAHGGIIPEGRFFQVVADDADMRLTSATISDAVSNGGLVVLFVCSAGRFDKHPMADTTTGLAKQLLDRGCAAVIASPWPLNASVPAYWLPTFLETWSSGLPVIDANFTANKAVEHAMGNSPANCLALTVYGDPLLKRAVGQ